MRPVATLSPLTSRTTSEGRRRGGPGFRGGVSRDDHARAASDADEAGLRGRGHPQRSETLSLGEDASAWQRRLLQTHLLRSEQRLVHGGDALAGVCEPLSLLLAPPQQSHGSRMALEGGSSRAGL